MNKLQKQLEQALTTAIEENDINTQMVLQSIIGIRRVGANEEMRKAIEEFTRKTLWLVLEKMKRDLIVQSN